jgi:hypothetical protein
MRESSVMTFRRYAILVTLTAMSLCAAVEAAAETAERFLVDAGQGPAGAQDFYLWMLAAIALITSVSLGRFVLFGVPTLVSGWYASNKQWLYTLLFAGMIWGVFYWM